MNEPDDRELARLEDPATWDWDSAEVHPGTPNPGIILEVRFQGADADAVLGAAEAAGMGAIEFVRQAAIAAASRSAKGHYAG
ncbi:MAG TPA: hypothetical protein VFE37_20865 [Chloroflexota bacterium]|nr:hypothetical protein [Chloroflexota bacterium]